MRLFFLLLFISFLFPLQIHAQLPKGKTWLIRTEEYAIPDSDAPKNKPAEVISFTETKEIRNDSNKVIYSMSIRFFSGKWSDSTETKNEYDTTGKLRHSFVIEKTIAPRMIDSDELFSGEKNFKEDSYTKTVIREEWYTDRTATKETTEFQDNDTIRTKDSTVMYAPNQPKCTYSFRNGQLNSWQEYLYTYDSKNRVLTTKEIDTQYDAVTSQFNKSMRITKYAYFEKDILYIVSYTQYAGNDTTEMLYKQEGFYDVKGHELYSQTWRDGKPDYRDTIYYRTDGKFEKRVRIAPDRSVISTTYFPEQTSNEKQVSYTAYPKGNYQYQVNYYTENDSVKFQESYFFESPVLLSDVEKPNLKTCHQAQFVQISKTNNEVLLFEMYGYGKINYRQKTTALD